MDIDVDMRIDTAIDIGIGLDFNSDIAIFPTGVCENNDHPYGKKSTAPRPPPISMLCRWVTVRVRAAAK